MEINVVLRSRLDAMLMASLLSPEFPSIHFRFLAGDPLSPTNSSARTLLPIVDGREVEVQWLGRPMSSIYSAARTLLAVHQEPVALVLDAGGTDPSIVSERRQAIQEVIGEAALRAPFHLLLAVPALQSLLFTRPALIVRAFGEGADEGGRVTEIGLLSPLAAYKKHKPVEPEASTAAQLIACLDADDIAEIRQEPPIREFIDFVTKFGSPVATAASPAP